MVGVPDVSVVGVDVEVLKQYNARLSPGKISWSVAVKLQDFGPILLDDIKHEDLKNFQNENTN